MTAFRAEVAGEAARSVRRDRSRALGGLDDVLHQQRAGHGADATGVGAIQAATSATAGSTSPTSFAFPPSGSS